MEEQKKQPKKLYQRWWIWVIGVVVIFFAWKAGGSAIEKARTKEIPSVMGIQYTDAEKVLKENGFKVTAIETDAGSIMESAYEGDKRSVKAGEVFKINDTLNPHLTGTTKDKKITIYYAKEDYTYEKPETEKKSPADSTASNADSAATASTSTSANTSSGWKQFLKDYEAWCDSYVALMKEIKDKPNDLSLISKSAKLAQESIEWAEKSDKYKDDLENMSATEFGEYMQTLSRILQKMSAIQ